MNLEGRLIANRYEIIEKVGNGGMATVYRAKDHILNRLVAVKILRDEFTTDEEFIKRFRSEAQAVASLNHPNIVGVYDVGNEGTLYYIVMELIQGKTLKEVIQIEGKLSWKWSVNVAIQIASALETAHKNNIIHRDIKPHNIIITEDGMAKVTDFGIAKAVSNSTITAFGTTIGSVHYFSPEHARGGYTDAKSDLYSLGVVMYEMLTGRVPFDADTPVSIALMHMQEKPVEPIVLNPNLPSSVNKIVMKAMQKDANLRYQSASEMLKDLNMALKNPDGNFVFMKDEENDFPTQKIPTMYDAEISKENPENKKHEKRKKESKFVAFVKKHKVISFIVCAILIFFATIGITYGTLKLTQVKDVTLPNVVGMTSEEAKTTLNSLKLVYTELEAQYSPDVAEGLVISQEPSYKENYNVKEKSEVKVVISKGQELTIVPKVVGMQKDEAISALQEANLLYEVIEETSKTVEEGYVISQETKENTQVNAGETVKIHVSIGTGIEQVDVPSALGKTEADARKLLEDSKLKVEVIYEENKANDNGKVLKQSIEAGKTVDVETTVVITVNKIIEEKTATITVDLKSITGGYKESSTTENNGEDEQTEASTTTGEDVAKTATVKITVDGTVKRQDSNVDKNSSIKEEIRGTGKVSIEVEISDSNGGKWIKTHTLDLTKETEYTFK
jgi:serine/threonine-protein kinase